MENEINQIKKFERSEEVNYIIDRMPTKFGFWVSAIILFLFFLMGIFGWIIRYPDVVDGQIVINTANVPVKLIANSSGRLKFNIVKSMDDVKKGQIIAYLENSATPDEVYHIDTLLKNYNPAADNIVDLIRELPKNVSMGELNVKFYSFTNDLQQLINYNKEHSFDKQIRSLQEMTIEEKAAVESAKKKIEKNLNNVNVVKKFYARDSTLFSKKVISESELDKSKMNFNSAEDSYYNSLTNLTNLKQQLQKTNSDMQEIYISKSEKNKELKLRLIASYNDLMDNITLWTQKYVFKSPHDGKIQFLNFFTENQFVQAGEEIFTIIAEQKDPKGFVVLPSLGSGKIATGQEVIVKLNDYPYMEYGSITGKVKSISLTSTVTRTEKSEIDSYLIMIDFPNRLKTNFGEELPLKADAKGTAEIVTKDRRLIQRLFDNLKYGLKK